MTFLEALEVPLVGLMEGWWMYRGEMGYSVVEVREMVRWWWFWYGSNRVNSSYKVVVFTFKKRKVSLSWVCFGRFLRCFPYNSPPRPAPELVIAWGDWLKSAQGS